MRKCRKKDDNSLQNNEKLKNDQHLQKKLEKLCPKLPNGWWVNDYFQDLYTSRHESYRKHERQQEPSVDKKLKYCVLCKKVWEIPPMFMNLGKELLYYDISSIGKTKKVCNKCNSKNL